MTKRLLILLAAMLALTACGGYTQVGADEVGVHKKGYMTYHSDTSIDSKCLEAGTTPRVGWGDKALVYPAGQRTYQIGGGANQDMDAIPVVTSDGAAFGITGLVTFYLNTDCKTLIAFHKNIGAKDWGGQPAYVGGDDRVSSEHPYAGWKTMLDAYIGQALTNIVNDLSGGKNSDALYKDAKIRKSLEGPIARALPGAVRAIAHGNYFKRFTVQINQPHAPDELVAAYNARVAAVQQAAAQHAKNEAVLSKTEQITECVRGNPSKHIPGLPLNTCTWKYAVDQGAITAVPQGGIVLPRSN